MRNNDTIVPDIDSALRWIARIAGGILVISVVVFFINDGRTLKLTDIKPMELVMTLALLVALLGLLVGWISEGIGGLLTLAGLITFTIFSYMSGSYMEWQVWLLGVPGLLFVLYWWRVQA